MHAHAVKHGVQRGVSAVDALALRSAIHRVNVQPTAEEVVKLLSQQQLLPAQASDLWAIARKNNFLNDEKLCTQYLHYQSTRGSVDMVKAAMDAMKQAGVVHTQRTYDFLIRAYVYLDNPVGILTTYLQLAQEDVEVTFIGGRILSYFAQQGNVDQVELFLALARKDPRQQYNVLYHVVIARLIQGNLGQGDDNKAMRYFREMEHLGIVPLTATFNILIHSDNIDFASALQLFNKMIKSNIVSTITYTGMIERCSRQGSLRECARLWNEMNDKGIEPSALCYSAIIQAYANRGHIRECGSIISDMISRGVRPPQQVFYAQARAYILKSALKDSVTVLNTMSAADVQPDENMYAMLVRAHMEANNLKQSVELVERAFSSGLEAGGLISILLSEYGDIDTTETHDALLEELDRIYVPETARLREAILVRRSRVPFPPGLSFSYFKPLYNYSNSLESEEPANPYHDPHPTTEFETPPPRVPLPHRTHNPSPIDNQSTVASPIDSQSAATPKGSQSTPVATIGSLTPAATPKHSQSTPVATNESLSTPAATPISSQSTPVSRDTQHTLKFPTRHHPSKNLVLRPYKPQDQSPEGGSQQANSQIEVNRNGKIQNLERKKKRQEKEIERLTAQTQINDAVIAKLAAKNDAQLGVIATDNPTSAQLEMVAQLHKKVLAEKVTKYM